MQGSFLRLVTLSAAATALSLVSGCATFKQMFDGNRARYASAHKVENPRVSGTANPNVLGTESDVSEAKLHSYDGATGKLCFLFRTPNPDALEHATFVAYHSLEDYDANKAQTEAAVTNRIVGTGKLARSYESTEKITHQDSTGQTYATTNVPVTKTETVRYSDVELCYPGRILTADTHLIGLTVSQPSLAGPSDTVVAAWKL